MRTTSTASCLAPKMMETDSLLCPKHAWSAAGRLPLFISNQICPTAEKRVATRHPGQENVLRRGRGSLHGLPGTPRRVCGAVVRSHSRSRRQRFSFNIVIWDGFLVKQKNWISSFRMCVQLNPRRFCGTLRGQSTDTYADKRCRNHFSDFAQLFIAFYAVRGSLSR